MCLAIPGKVIEIDADSQTAVIDYGGLTRKAATALMPQVAIDDYVLVHAGFIIQILDDQYVNELNTLTEGLTID